MKRLLRKLALYYALLELLLVGLAVLLKLRARSTTDVTSDDVRLTAALGAEVFRSEAFAFTSAEVTTVYCAASLDLREAAPGASPMTVVVRAFRGGVNIVVPQGWEIEVTAKAISGGTADRTEPSEDPNAPRLIVSGLLVMGGVIVQHSDGALGEDEIEELINERSNG
jgi:predicted membrane protein